jgi:competence protein ComEC
VFSFLLHFFLGWIAGTASQLQQATLWLDGLNLAGFCTSAFLLAKLIVCRHRLTLTMFLQCALVLVMSAATAFFCCAYRAQVFLANQISPRLQKVGSLAKFRAGWLLYCHNEWSKTYVFVLRFNTAQLVSGEPVELPPQVMLGWYADTLANGPAPTELQAGDIWKFSVKLKAPHGHINPHGFDYELWLWEQVVCKQQGMCAMDPKTYHPS